MAADAREVEARYAKFRKAESFREPIKAVYLSLYLFPALLILFGAVWLALYLARRITTPLRLVAEGAERIAAGERGVRVEFPSGDDEFQALIASFNRMSERLARSEEEVEHTPRGAHAQEPGAGGAAAPDRDRAGDGGHRRAGRRTRTAHVTAVNAAACRVLDLDGGRRGRPGRSTRRSRGPGREEVASLVRRLLSGRVARQEREVAVPARGRDRHLAVTVVPLPGPRGLAAGRGGGDGRPHAADARAEGRRLGRGGAQAGARDQEPADADPALGAARAQGVPQVGARLRAVLTECTCAIVDEVDALKNLVDEFAQFARLPAANLATASLHEVVDQALSLYDGLFGEVRIERRLAPDVPAAAARRRPDEARRSSTWWTTRSRPPRRRGRSWSRPSSTARRARVRLGVADDGPGIRPEDKDKLFVPHFSTKRRGSGLGLAIVSRIVQEHQGVIRVEDNHPRGARFVVELPA